jgi:trehalose 6-phosphate synthase/phosphatase
MRVLRARIAAYDVHRWATSFLEALGGPPGEPGQKQTALRSREDIDALGQRLRASERLLLLLDYDGTLVPFARAPELASPDRSLRELLASLARRPGFAVHVVSGRRRETLERWLGELPIGLHAEHGYWSRMAPDQAWEGIEGVSLAWKPRIRALFDQWTLATPGALVEEKTATLAWHFRMAEPELGAENAAALWSVVEQSLGDSSAELLRGDKVIEVRPRVVTKARVAERVLGRQGEPPPTIVAMGDDGTDEDMFRVLPPVAFTISVGPRPSAARYRVATPGVVRDLLERLL